MSGKRRGPAGDQDGFTIIEVMIALAIAGLILLIIFLVVPVMQRDFRNYDRKRAVNDIVPQLEDYKNDHGHLPDITCGKDDDGNPPFGEGNTEFVPKYLTEINSKYTIVYRSNCSSHSYVPPLDTIVIQANHWCNRYNDGMGIEDPSDPIAGTDYSSWLYVIWTTLEDGHGDRNVYCIDNRR